ncbi:MAG TPA: hypothetical protein VF348_07630 [Usitatibacter sp.]
MKTMQRAFLASLFLAVPALAADGIAFITNLKGDVAVDGNPRPAILSELNRGQKIAVGRDSQASVMYISNGKEYLLKGPADYVVKDTEVSGSAGMPPVTRETAWRANDKVLVQVAQTSAASVRMRSIALPKPDTEPKLLFPTQGSIATLQPTFRWRAGDPKASGEFVLLVVGHDKPVHIARVSAGTYRVPAKLLPDTDYTWTVTIAGNEVGSGRFRTLSHDALAQVEKRKPSDKAEFSDRLLFTLMLQEMGATQEAREGFAKLAQERSDLPELAALAK